MPTSVFRWFLITGAVFAALAIGGFLYITPRFGDAAFRTFILATAVVWTIADFGIYFGAVFRERTSLRTLAERHAGSPAIRARVSAWPGSPEQMRAMFAVVADRRGLSFRSSADEELGMVPAADIAGFTLVPQRGSSQSRLIRVDVREGAIEFTTTGGTSQSAADAIATLEAALGRHA